MPRAKKAVAPVTDRLPVLTPEEVVAQALPAPVALPVTEVARRLVAAAVEADKAVEAAGKLVVSNQDQFNMATDVASSIKKVNKDLDDFRLALARPYTAAAKQVSDLFKRPGERLTAALDAIRRKMTAWHAEEQKRREQEAAAQRAAEQAEADRLAAATRALGDEAGAQQITEEAAARTVEPVKVSGAGVFGGAVSAQKRPTGTVTDLRAFLFWLLDKQQASLPQAANLLGGIEFSKVELNRLAKLVLELPEGHSYDIPGFKAEYDTGLAIR